LALCNGCLNKVLAEFDEKGWCSEYSWTY
jgi:hypothetical protein